MSQRKERESTDDRAGAHLTTRRGFVTTCGLGGLSLYFLWAAYGAAPTSFDFMSAGKGGGMGHGGGGGITPEEFERQAEKFFEAHKLADGSVKVPRSEGKGDGRSVEKAGGHDEKKGGMPGMKKGEAGGHDEKKGGHDKKTASGHDEKTVDVYILSRRFGYQPEVLRLERGVSYKFRIMPMDADHGASISFGTGSRIIRCRAGVLSEVELRFEKKGEFFMYCTVYCGDGHDMMRSKIIVT